MWDVIFVQRVCHLFTYFFTMWHREWWKVVYLRLILLVKQTHTDFMCTFFCVANKLFMHQPRPQEKVIHCPLLSFSLLLCWAAYILYLAQSISVSFCTMWSDSLNESSVSSEHPLWSKFTQHVLTCTWADKSSVIHMWACIL